MVELLGAKTPTGKAAWVAAVGLAVYLWVRPQQPAAGGGGGGKGVGLAGGEYGSGPLAAGGSTDYRQIPTIDRGGR